MAGWLESAARALGRGAPAVPVETPYEIVCGCGHAVSGMRRRTPQAPQCRCCGERVFVLPLDVYPPPRARKPPTAPVKPPAPPVVTPEPPPLEDEDPTGPLEPAPPPVLAPRREREASPRRPSPAPPLRPEARLTLPRRRFFTRLRLLALAILALLVATGTLIWQSQRREQAEIVIGTRVDLLAAALEARNWGEAEPILNELCRAAEILGRDDPDARRWRRQQREVTALNRRSLVSFFDFLRQIEPAMLDSDAAWDAHFRISFQGQWLLLDAPVYRTTDEAGLPRILVDLPVAAGRRPVEIDAPLAAFEALNLTNEPQRVLFAAQLGACRLPGPSDPRLVIRLVPETGFLWCTSETLAGTGLEGDDEDERRALGQRLGRQSRLCGMTE